MKELQQQIRSGLGLSQIEKPLYTSFRICRGVVVRRIVFAMQETVTALVRIQDKEEGQYVGR